LDLRFFNLGNFTDSSGGGGGGGRGTGSSPDFEVSLDGEVELDPELSTIRFLRFPALDVVTVLLLVLRSPSVHILSNASFRSRSSGPENPRLSFDDAKAGEPDAYGVAPACAYGCGSKLDDKGDPISGERGGDLVRENASSKRRSKASHVRNGSCVRFSTRLELDI